MIFGQLPLVERRGFEAITYFSNAGLCVEILGVFVIGEDPRMDSHLSGLFKTMMSPHCFESVTPHDTCEKMVKVCSTNT